MLSPDDPALSPRKRRMLAFMRDVLHGDRPDLIPAYVRPDYIQHTPGIGQGREGLARYFEEVASKRPGRHEWRPVMMLEEGDIVVLFKWLPGAWIADFCRFDAGDMLAEHWDVVQRWDPPAPDPDALGTEDLGRFRALFGLEEPKP